MFSEVPFDFIRLQAIDFLGISVVGAVDDMSCNVTAMLCSLAVALLGSLSTVSGYTTVILCKGMAIRRSGIEAPMSGLKCRKHKSENWEHLHN